MDVTLTTWAELNYLSVSEGPEFKSSTPSCITMPFQKKKDSYYKIFTISPMMWTNFIVTLLGLWQNIISELCIYLPFKTRLFFCVIWSADHHWTEPQSLLLNKGNLGTRADVDIKKQPSTQVRTRNSSQESYKSLKQILSAAVFSDKCNLLKEIEAAEKLGGCTIDFQIWKRKKEKKREIFHGWPTYQIFLVHLRSHCCNCNCNSDILHLTYHWSSEKKEKKSW